MRLLYKRGSDMAIAQKGRFDGMAIFHMSAKIVSRGKGQSAVAAAAYRHAAKMEFEREGRSVNYENKEEVIGGEVTLPQDAPEWAKALVEGKRLNEASSNVWNAVENFERRADAQLAREIVVALPLELSVEQNEETLREFASHFTDRGHIVDWAFHNAEGHPHAHIMLTLRPLTPEGFGKKKVPLLNDLGEVMRHGTGKNTRVIYREFFGDKQSLRAERNLWAELNNARLESLGFDARIDPRSFAARGIEMEPTTHKGLASSQMNARGVETERAAMIRERELANVELIKARPEILFDVITSRKSVFDGEDIAKTLLTYVQDRELFQSLLPVVTNSQALIGLQRELTNPVSGRVVSKQKLTTRDMVALEADMVERAVRLNSRLEASASGAAIEASFERFEASKGFPLNAEQKGAVRAITNAEQLAAVVGLAGTGKSTMLNAARDVWESEGKRVMGFAIASKAAKGLEEGSGIASRTLASFDYRMGQGMDALTSNDVLVVDEAGMVGSRELGGLLERAEAVGAKVVLVGDPDQLPAISAGAAFRAVIEHTGYTELSTIIRQKEAWMRAASLDFAVGRIEAAVGAYERRGYIIASESAQDAVSDLATGFVEDYLGNTDTIALAHSNKAVSALNAEIRLRLKERGVIGEGGGFETSRGWSEFGAGDRIVFLQNDKYLLRDSGILDAQGVRNGERATVEASEDGVLSLRLEDGRAFSLNSARYSHIQHGFATTIHKAQGMTVDNAHFLAQRSTVTNLANVAMTRHRKSARLYYSKHSFSDLAEYENGLASALGRADIKEVTTDYDLSDEGRAEQVIDAFAARRGFDTQGQFEGADKAIRPSDFERAKASTWFIPPRALNSYAATQEAEAELRMSASRVYQRDMEKVDEAAQSVFANPKAAMENLTTFAKTSDLSNRAVSDYVRENLETFGGLAGRTGLMVPKAEKETRARAVKQARDLVIHMREWKTTIDRQRERKLAEVVKERTLDAQGIKALRPEDLGFVALYEGATEPSAEQIAAYDLSEASAERLERFHAEIDRRFGHVATFLKENDAMADPASQKTLDILRENKAMLLNTRAAASNMAFRPGPLANKDLTL